MEQIIPLFKPQCGKEEIEAVTKVLKSGWWGMGKVTEEFEKKFAEYIGVKHAIAVSSCTEALRIVLKDIIRGGDEVIVSPITFVSTVHAIVYNGGIPVFADVSRETLNINPEDIKRRITKKTKAIIVVHLYGQPCQMGEIFKIASSENNLYTIEDCAHACGSRYNMTNSKCGSKATGCFSFHAVKNLATGDGGMITTNSDSFAEWARKARWLGISKSTHQRLEGSYGWNYDVESIGFKSHMNDITASIGLAQLDKLEKNNEKRRKIFKRYNEKLADIVETPLFSENSSCHIYAIRTPYRDKLNLWLKDKGISSGVHYKPIYSHSVYAKYYGRDFYLPIAESEWKKLLSLPIYPDLSVKEQDYIVKSIREFHENPQKS